MKIFSSMVKKLIFAGGSEKQVFMSYIPQFLSIILSMGLIFLPRKDRCSGIQVPGFLKVSGKNKQL